MKKICIILCFTLLAFSCEKEDDVFIPGVNKTQRIKSIKQYSNDILGSELNYTYDDYGRLIEWESTYLNQYGDTMHSYKRIFEYNTNKIIEYREENEPGVYPANKTEREIQNGMVSKIFQYQWNGEVWDIVSRTSYIYDDTKLSRWNQINFTSSFGGMIEGELVYEGNLLIQKNEKHQYYNFMGINGHKLTNYNKEIYSYADGNLQTVISSQKWDFMEDWETNSKIEFHRSGQEITRNGYSFSQEETWKLSETTILTFDEQGFITNTKTFYPESDYVSETKTEYEYRPGNWENALEYPDRNIYEIALRR